MSAFTSRKQRKNKASNSHGWNYLGNRIVWSDVEYSQDTIKDALVIQEAPIDVYMIKKVKTKVFHSRDTHSSCTYISYYWHFVCLSNKTLEAGLLEAELLNDLTFLLNNLLLHKLFFFQLKNAHPPPIQLCSLSCCKFSLEALSHDTGFVNDSDQLGIYPLSRAEPHGDVLWHVSLPGEYSGYGGGLKCLFEWDEKWSHKLLERSLVQWEVREDVSSIMKKELLISSYK